MRLSRGMSRKEGLKETSHDPKENVESNCPAGPFYSLAPWLMS